MKKSWPKRRVKPGWSNKNKLVLLSLLGLAVFAVAAPRPPAGFAGTSPKEKKAVIVLINGVSWDEFREATMPATEKLYGKAALALLSPRTAATNATTFRSHATLSAGSRAQADTEAALGFNAEEEWENLAVSDWYQSLTGRRHRGEILHLGLSRLEKRNERVNYEVLPGALGEELKMAGLRTAVVGNADRSKNTFESIHREATLIAMDRRGNVHFGNVGKQMLEQKGAAPFSVQTNYGELTRELFRVLTKSNLIVVETGDVYRADLFSSQISEELLKRYKSEALKRVDDFLEELVPALKKENTLLIITALSPPKGLGQRDVLTPVVMWGEQFNGGLATSASTRRPGLLTNLDIAPTILDHFSIQPPSYFLGRKAVARPHASDRITFLTDFSVRSSTNDISQPLMIISYIALALFTFLFTVFYLSIVKRKERYLTVSVSSLLLAVLALPLSYFLLPLLVPSGLGGGWYFISSFALTALLVGVAHLLGKNVFGPVGVLVGLTTAVMTVDLMTGANLNINTVFGYSPIVAGRFYGLGNQGLAIFLAASLLSAVLWLEWRATFNALSKVAIIIFFLAVVLIVGFPRWGADVGGTITTVVAFSATYFSLVRRKIRLKHVVIVLVAAIAMIGLFAAVDIFQQKTEETHLGRTVELIKAEGNSAVLQVIQRKVSTNVRILRYSSWSYFLLVILGLLLYLRFRPIGQFQKLLGGHFFLGAGITGAFVGALIGFLTNDSGIVIPALILSYFTAAIFYLMIQEHKKTAVEGTQPERRDL